MSIFEDKFHKELDDISKMIEPFQHPLNEKLAQLPDELLLTYDDINAININSSILPAKVLTNKHSKFKGSIHPLQSTTILISPPKKFN